MACLIIVQEEAKVMRTYIVAKQVTKKGKKRERKMKKALATIKVINRIRG